MQEIGNFVRDIIVERTQKDGSIVKGNRLTNNPPLSNSYVTKRRKFTRLSPKTTPTTSNLTRTGEMLAALRARATKKDVILYFSSKEAQTKASLVQNKRPFMGLSKTEQRLVVELLTDLLLQS